MDDTEITEMLDSGEFSDETDEGDDFDTDDDEEEHHVTSTITTVPAQKMVLMPNPRATYFLEKRIDKRVRNEWSEEEDTIFLKGLEEHKLEFGEIQKLLPHRSRSQIRTHYRYLARSIRANLTSEALGGKKVRRLRTRGRPSRSKKETKVTPLFEKLSKVVEDLERKNPSKRRGRPSKFRIGSVMQFNSPSSRNIQSYSPGESKILPYPPVKVTIITPNLRVDSQLIYNAPGCLVPGIENYDVMQTFNFQNQPQTVQVPASVVSLATKSSSIHPPTSSKPDPKATQPTAQTKKEAKNVQKIQDNTIYIN